MKKGVSLLLSAVLTLGVAAGFAGCNTETADTDGEIYPTYADDKELMIGGWDSPIPTKENYQAAKDMGLTHIFLDQVYANIDSPQYAEILDWCEEIGLDAILLLGSNVDHDATEEWTDADWELLYERAESPAADMICYWDEPFVDNFGDVLDIVNRHNAKYGDDPEAPTFNVTYNPQANVNSNEVGTISYQEYADKLWEEVMSKVQGEKFLSLDVYPLYQSNGATGVSSGWLPKLETMANLAKENDADFHMFIQNYWDTSADGTTRRVDDVDLSYQVYVCMAFGITGFSYFTYTESFLSSMTGGCVTREDCEPTELYYYAQELNTELKKFDNVYLSFDWQGVYTILGSENETGVNIGFEAMKDPLDSLSCADSVSATQDTVIGQFKDKDGNDGLLIANYSDPAARLSDAVSLEFKDADRALVWRNGERSVYVLKDGVLNLELEAGEGVFVIPVKV